MTKNEARAIVSDIARNNARGWLAQVTRNGRVYYSIEKVNRCHDFWWVTLAVGIDRHGFPGVDFFWPSPRAQYSVDDHGEEARVLLGESEAVSVAAKAVGFDMKRRCFTVGGGGTDISYEALRKLALKSDYIGSIDVDRTSMNRSEGHL